MAISAEKILVKLAKSFGGKSFAPEDFEDANLIDDAMDFAMGMYIMMARQDEVKSITEDGNNLYVVEYNPYMLLVAKVAVAANIGYSEYNGKRLTFVVVDNMFKSMDAQSQRAIIAHEIGHTMSNHSAAHNARTLKKEGQADAYAASIIGVDNMVVAFNEIGRNNLNILSRIELKIRIHMLLKR